MSTKRVRILADQRIDGLQYRCNQVVDLPSDIAKPLIKDGSVDDERAAVAYCTGEMGATVITHITSLQRAAQEALAAAESASAQARAAVAGEQDAEKRAALESAVVDADAAVAAAQDDLQASLAG